MTADVINLLGQVPLVGVFLLAVWLFNVQFRREREAESARWREFIASQNERISSILSANTSVLRNLDSDVQELVKRVEVHDRGVMSALDHIKSQSARQRSRERS